MTEKLVSEISPEYLVAVSKSGVPVGYKQTEIGVIPDDWKIATIGDTCELLTGFPFPSSSYADSGVRLLRGSNVKRGCTDWSDDITQYWPEVTSTVKQYELMAGDIVISMDGSLVGRSFAQLNEADLPALLLQRVARVRSSSVSQNYLKEWICSKFFTEHCDSVKTVTAIPHISPQDIRTFKFVLPISNEEQTAIANALSDVDALIQELEKLIAKKQAIKTATMQQLLTGRTRLPQFAHHPDGRKKGYKPSELGEIPEDWECIKMGDLAKIQRGASPRPIDSPIWFDRNSSVGWLRISDLTRTNKFLTETTQSLSELGISHSRFVPKNNLVMSICATVGKPIITKRDLCIHDGFVVFNGLTVNQDFMYYILKELEDEWSKQGQTGSQMNLNTDLINGTNVCIPNLTDEQVKIALILSDMDEEVQALEQRLNKTRQIKQGMMQELLTGKTRLVKLAGVA